jgi:hypothetical protein
VALSGIPFLLLVGLTSVLAGLLGALTGLGGGVRLASRKAEANPSSGIASRDPEASPVNAMFPFVTRRHFRVVIAPRSRPTERWPRSFEAR